MCVLCVIDAAKRCNGIIIGEFLRRDIVQKKTDTKRIDFVSEELLATMLAITSDVFTSFHPTASSFSLEGTYEDSNISCVKYSVSNENFHIGLISKSKNIALNEIQFGLMNVNSLKCVPSLGAHVATLYQNLMWADVYNHISNKTFLPVTEGSINEFFSDEVNTLLSDGFSRFESTSNIIVNKDVPCKQCKRNVFPNDAVCWMCETKNPGKY